MFCRAFGLCHRALAALLLLALLVCGAEVGLRCYELQSPPNRALRSSTSYPAVVVPSWTAFQELKPLARLSSKSGEKVMFQTNRFGIRGPDVGVPKPPDVYRVLCLGDESLLGMTLREEELLTTQLQTALQSTTRLRVEVCNAAVPGACPLTEFLLLTHRLAALQPDLVIATVSEHDAAEDHAYRRFTRIDPQGLPLACRHPSLGRQPRTDALTSYRQEFRLLDFGLNWAGRTWKRKTEHENSLDAELGLGSSTRWQADPASLARTVAPLAAISRWCHGSSSAFLAVEITNQPGPASTSPSLLNETLTEQAQSEKFPTAQLIRVPPEAGEQRNQLKNWSVAEHHQFAAQLADRILATVPGPWSSPYFQQEQSHPEPSTITPVTHQSRQFHSRPSQTAGEFRERH